MTSRYTAVSVVPGTLTVDRAPVTITTASETKVYDGMSLPTNTDAPTVSGTFYEEYISTYSTAEWFSDVGSSENSGDISWGGANPNNYSVTRNFGTLTIKKLNLNINLGSMTLYRDKDTGTLYLAESTDPKLTYGNGSHAGEAASASGGGSFASRTFTFNLFTGATITLSMNVPDGITQTGSYQFVVGYSVSGSSSSNFGISLSNGVINVVPLPEAVDPMD